MDIPSDSITAHWINDDWEMHNNVLKTKEFKESHTAENIGECIQEILEVLGIKVGSVIATTTDNGTNYINSVETSSNGKYTMYGAHNKIGCVQRVWGQSH